MQKSDSLKSLSKALSAVQKEIQPALKDSANPFFKSKYADLNSVWASCRDLLTKNGLSVAQGNSVGLDHTVIVETLLMHESGEWIQSELSLPLAKNDPQGVGSAVTYGRRYGLAAIIGIVADVDDDGNHASGHNGGTAPAKSAPKPTPADGLREGVKIICRNLNETNKDSILWGPGTITDYLTEYFGKPMTLDKANEAQLRTIEKELRDRLTMLQEAK